MFRLIAPLFISLFGIIVSIYSYITYQDFSSYGAAFYPTVIGVLVALFAIIDFCMERNIRHKYIFQVFDIKRDIKYSLMISLIVLFYILVIDYLGFIVTTSIILLSLTLPYIKEKRMLIGSFLIIISTGIYFLFAKVLLVPLSSGILF